MRLIEPLPHLLARRRSASVSADGQREHSPSHLVSIRTLLKQATIAGAVVLACVLAAICLPKVKQAKVFLPFIPDVERAENDFIDRRFRYRGAQDHQNPHEPKITIIAIDALTLNDKRLNKPLLFWGKEHARLFHILHENKARAIGIDIVQPIAIPKGDPNAKADEAERRAIETIPGIVLPFNRTTVGTNKVVDTYPYEELRKVLQKLCKWEDQRFDRKDLEDYLKLDNCSYLDNCGFSHVILDSDSAVRRFAVTNKMWDKAGGHLYYSFGFAVALQALKHGMKAESIHNDRDLRVNPERMIDYAGPAGWYKTISYVNVLQNPKKYRADIEGHICLVGVTDFNQLDYHKVPFVDRTRNTAGLMSGVEIQANIIRTLLTDFKVRRVGHLGTMIGVLLTVLILNLLYSGYHFRKLNELARSNGLERLELAWLKILLFGLGVAGFWLLFCFAIFRYGGCLLPLVPVGLTILLESGAVAALHRRHEQRYRAWLDDVLSLYVSSSVLEYFAKKPGKLRLGGEPQEVTIMFLDVRGFTAFSRNFSGGTETEKTLRKLAEVLNDYLAAMEEVIFDQDGIIDKYTGDGLMAIFNWPQEQEDHACRAVRAALKIQDRVEQLALSWEARGLRDIKPLNIGIGINTGTALVGNIGSERRMNLTATGYTVNVAARLEGHNKDVDVNRSGRLPILINESTMRGIQECCPEFAQREKIEFVQVEEKTELRGIEKEFFNVYTVFR